MSKAKGKKETISEATPPQAFPTEATSKAKLMANVLDVMGKASQMDLTYLHDQAMALIGKEASQIPSGAAAKNLASIGSSNAVKEELDQILSGETLSEDFKDKASVLFEAAVGQAVALKAAEIEEMYETRLNEEIDEMNTALSAKIDQYLTYVAEQWVKTNKPAIDQSIRTQLAENFISGMFKLFSENYVSIPEDKVDAVEALSKKVEELQEQLNNQINENIENAKKLQDYQKGDALKEISEGLAMTQVDKLKKLSEGVDFGSGVDVYKKKLRVLRESYFDKKPSQVLKEAETPVEDKKPEMNPMLSLKEFIENSVKN